MTRLVVAVAIVLAAARGARAQPQRMAPGDAAPTSDEAPEVLVMTFGVGPRIFEKFGHAALCLQRSGPGDPVCFNYGVTDFAAGADMVWDFLRTQQKFWVEPESYESIMRFYQREDRDIYLQVIPLAPDAARALEKKLLSDLDEAHRYYVYDMFFDNCTTRLRDLVDTATGGKLRAGTDSAFGLTYREMGESGLAEFPWITALSDFVVGRQLDDTPTQWQAMFHPDILRAQIEAKLGVAPQQLYKRHGAPFPKDGPTDRVYAIAIALVFALPLALARWRRRFERVALAWATVYLALCGIAIWGLVIVSSIPGVRWNEAALVLVPLDLALPFLPAPRRLAYARVRVSGLLCVSALAAVGILHQPLWIPILSAMMPLALVAFDRQAVVGRG